MPFINGRFYMNPAYGRALEAARLADEGAEDEKPEMLAASDPPDGNDHWVTINHHHVLIHEGTAARGRMSLSTKGLDFIKRHEGLRLKPYSDQAGHSTIGYGHKIEPREDFSKGITAEEATALQEITADGTTGHDGKTAP